MGKIWMHHPTFAICLVINPTQRVYERLQNIKAQKQDFNMFVHVLHVQKHGDAFIVTIVEMA